MPAVAAILGAALLAGSSRADLASRYQAGKRRAEQLRSEIQADATKIHGFDGTIGSLEQRLGSIERSISIQERELSNVRYELGQAQTRLANLQTQFARGRRILAAELVAEYESPPPTMMNVVVDAHGFDDLLNRINDMRAIERRNTETVRLVKSTRIAVAAQTRRLTAIEARRQRAVTAVLVERDDVAQLRLSIVGRELVYVNARSRKARELASLRRTLTRQATVLDSRAAAAARASSTSTGGVAAVPPGGCANTPFVPHGGPYGFFPAAGTNYSVNQEPIIAARLDELGRALQLHLSGVSGYRTPAHSVEVGGFADDPHTQGLASDTPGVEGVPESTLAQFCLTRPFGGAPEADHIQES
jgi:peptidoglycan hydrolase CwlO-like protein